MRGDKRQTGIFGLCPMLVGFRTDSVLYHGVWGIPVGSLNN